MKLFKFFELNFSVKSENDPYKIIEPSWSAHGMSGPNVKFENEGPKILQSSKSTPQEVKCRNKL